ncbi:MAG: hypothetical protein SCALA701_16940 [Candidatus Scalindua sp.]|nr:MAG: hypothetical protein SCALA701_16940 [Candidatus Scalindua sp.]
MFQYLWISNGLSYPQILTTRHLLLSRTSLLNETLEDWNEFLNLTTSEQDVKMLQQHERTGRPLGSDGFLTRLEKPIGRLLKPKRSG